jgi:hypothetical protein
MVFGFRFADTQKVVKVYDTGSFPVKSMVVSILYLIAVKDETEMIILPRNSTASVKKAFSPSPIISITANDNMIFAGSRAGSIVAWSITSLQIIFSLEDHESQANKGFVSSSVAHERLFLLSLTLFRFISPFLLYPFGGV